VFRAKKRKPRRHQYRLSAIPSPSQPIHPRERSLQDDKHSICIYLLSISITTKKGMQANEDEEKPYVEK
jgi:hypothetical protein